MKLRQIYLSIAFFLTLLASTWAGDAVNANWRGLAIKGYDPVAYFTVGKPVEGSGDFEYKWSGATWRFASEKNRAQFEANPAAYAPQFGGFCAWAVSQGYTATIDPAAWRIVEGKLYLNYSAKVQTTWEKDMAENIKKADANWPKLRDS